MGNYLFLYSTVTAPGEYINTDRCVWTILLAALLEENVQRKERSDLINMISTDVWFLGTERRFSVVDLSDLW